MDTPDPFWGPIDLTNHVLQVRRLGVLSHLTSLTSLTPSPPTGLAQRIQVQRVQTHVASETKRLRHDGPAKHARTVWARPPPTVVGLTPRSRVTARQQGDRLRCYPRPMLLL